jgi:hypothetical protein
MARLWRMARRPASASSSGPNAGVRKNNGAINQVGRNQKPKKEKPPRKERVRHETVGQRVTRNELGTDFRDIDLLTLHFQFACSLNDTIFSQQQLE